jgi:hypothetical protein
MRLCKIDDSQVRDKISPGVAIGYVGAYLDGFIPDIDTAFSFAQTCSAI